MVNMARQQFMTQAQFRDRYEVITKPLGNGTSLLVKSKSTGNVLYTDFGDKDKIIDEMYFQFNVVNYVNANKRK